MRKLIEIMRKFTNARHGGRNVRKVTGLLQPIIDYATDSYTPVARVYAVMAKL